jgi:hypothetical protein
MGTIEGTGPQQGDPDAPMGPTPDAPAGSGSDSGTSGFQCRNPQAAPGSGNHNAGQDCMGSCHNHGFTLAGTLFNNGVAVVGASITVADANGATFDMVTMRNGNFYTSKTIAFPVHVVASSCPNVAMMSGPIAQGQGCNKSGCHVAGAQGQIHLP